MNTTTPPRGISPLGNNRFYKPKKGNTGETSAQTIDPLVGEVQLPEGDDLTLSCNYTASGTNDELHWYRQSPGSSPEFLLYISLYGAKSDPPPRMSAGVDKDLNRVDLKISSAAVSDSALYYCALRPTVTGNPETLYRNWYEGNVNNLHWYRQYPGSRPEFLLLKYPTSPEVTRADPPFPRLDAAVNGSVVELKISSAAVSDSALYYCALAPTVTGNPDTLYRNWFYD
ncbi:hypothetical protein NFI96_008316 [Prochilodus magdalenae]|nr:hypothetical protein NFI96_008316 [Prochilodus magdalenae]